MSIEPGPLLAAIALLGAVAVVMVLPYEQYLLLTILLVYLLDPLPAPPAQAHRESGVGGTACQKGFLSTRALVYFSCGRSDCFGLGGCKEFERSLGRDLDPGSRIGAR